MCCARRASNGSRRTRAPTHPSRRTTGSTTRWSGTTPRPHASPAPSTSAPWAKGSFACSREDAVPEDRSISIEVVYRGIFQKTLAQRICRSVVLAQTDKAERPYTLGIVAGGASFAGLWVFKDDHTDYRVLGALAKILPQWISLENAKAATKELAKGDEGAIASVQFGYDSTAMRPVSVGEGTSGHEVLQFTKPGWTTMRPGIIVDARKPGERNPYYKKYGAG